ncbi:hypothetical protein PLANTIT3_70041 [Plantibacter sp. T3]|nr:hypothetical protein PLANTIT3_70041 [Plantibacter sp. T3]
MVVYCFQHSKLYPHQLVQTNICSSVSPIPRVSGTKTGLSIRTIEDIFGTQVRIRHSWSSVGYESSSHDEHTLGGLT